MNALPMAHGAFLWYQMYTAAVECRKWQINSKLTTQLPYIPSHECTRIVPPYLYHTRRTPYPVHCPQPAPRAPHPVPRTPYPVPRTPYPVPRTPYPVPRTRTPYPVPNRTVPKKRQPILKKGNQFFKKGNQFLKKGSKGVQVQVRGTGYGVRGTGYGVRGTGYGGTGYRVYRVQGTGYRVRVHGQYEKMVPAGYMLQVVHDLERIHPAAHPQPFPSPPNPKKLRWHVAQADCVSSTDPHFILSTMHMSMSHKLRRSTSELNKFRWSFPLSLPAN